MLFFRISFELPADALGAPSSEQLRCMETGQLSAEQGFYLLPLRAENGLLCCAAVCHPGVLKGTKVSDLAEPVLRCHGLTAAGMSFEELLPDDVARLVADVPPGGPHETLRREFIRQAEGYLQLMQKYSSTFGLTLVPKSEHKRRPSSDIMEFAGTVKHPVLFLVGFRDREAVHTSEWLAAKIHADGVTPSRKLVTGSSHTLSMADVADGFAMASGGSVILHGLSRLLGCETGAGIDMSKWNGETAEGLKAVIRANPNTAAILCEPTGHEEFAARVQRDILKGYMQVRIENQREV